MAARWPNVILTGFMGTGKSTVGNALAKKLCYEYIDTDSRIEAAHGPIPTIFADEGEDAFRRYEREIALELAGLDGCVISTGGRLMLDPASAGPLTESGFVFCLTASLDTILHRVTEIADPSRRPLLAGENPRERLEELLAERSLGYARYPQIDTNGKTPGEIADEIIAELAPDNKCSEDP